MLFLTPAMPEPNLSDPQTAAESNESFQDLLSEYERDHAHRDQEGRKQLEGTVVSVTPELVFLDIGYKVEGVLPPSAFTEPPKPGDKYPVSIKGRNEEGYYELSRSRVVLPTDWSALERAFNEKATIMGTVTGVVKGGISVDVGVRAFMPASRTGTRDAAEMEKLIGQEISCRIIKLDVADEDVVVDHRAVAEEEALAAKGKRYEELKEGDLVTGVVRSLTDYGAFVDIGGVDALLHVSDISWTRVSKPADALAIGQQVEAKILKIDLDKKRISIGAKQLLAHPWDSAASKYKPGDRVRGTVTRVVDFGAFVELEPGVEGLIHISDLSWTRRVKRVSEVVKEGDQVEAVVLNVNPADRRMSLSLKQAVGDPWQDAARKFLPGTVVEGPVTKLEKFGAFVQMAEGVEGLVHVSEISAEKRIEHPRDLLKVGQVVQALVLAVDAEKRQAKLSMKQLVPTSVDEYVAEHKPGDVVTGRIIDVSGQNARVELGQGIVASCRITSSTAASEEKGGGEKADLSSLTAMLNAKWKSGSAPVKPQELAAGQIRSFRITKLTPAEKKIEVELA